MTACARKATTCTKIGNSLHMSFSDVVLSETWLPLHPTGNHHILGHAASR